MLIYSDHLTQSDVYQAFAATDLHHDGVFLELHGNLRSRKRARRHVVKLSADPGADRFGTKRRWANSGSWGAATPNTGYAVCQLGDKAATFDEWGVFIDALFKRDPDAIVGIYNSPDELAARWADPRKVTA